MIRSLVLMLPLCALITGCQTASKQSACDGFAKLRPTLETSVFILKNDRSFANQVSSQNRVGKSLGCWQ